VRKTADGGHARTEAQPVEPKPVDVHTRAAEDKLSLALGVRVRIVRRGGSGVIEVPFTSEDELIRIFERITDGS
jgi:hypothetical protein